MQCRVEIDGVGRSRTFEREATAVPRAGAHCIGGVDKSILDRSLFRYSSIPVPSGVNNCLWASSVTVSACSIPASNSVHGCGEQERSTPGCIDVEMGTFRPRSARQFLQGINATEVCASGYADRWPALCDAGCGTLPRRCPTGPVAWHHGRPHQSSAMRSTTVQVDPSPCRTSNASAGSRGSLHRCSPARGVGATKSPGR